MENIRKAAFFLAGIFFVIMTNAQDKGFKTDKKTGVEYCFIKHDKKGAPYAGSEFARVVMVWTGRNAKGDADSLYFSSSKISSDSLGSITLPVKSKFSGSLEEGIMMMSPGDSAAFKVNADSLYIKGFNFPPARIPHYIDAKTKFTFNVKLVDFETKDEVMANRQAEMKKRQAKIEARKGQEPSVIAEYLQKNNLNIKPDADSIFFLQTTPGNGPQVQDGDSIVVKYKGTFLDGGVFDPGNQPIKMIYSKNMPLIQGWVKILGTMSQGEKVRVLIPSKLAYGGRGAGQIMPYTPLIFDMELLSVKPNK